jgi:DNA (cytosine-5)-methyltransferase 1
MRGFIDLFSGIGGFALAAHWASLKFDKHYFSEIDEFGINIYKKHFPEAEYLGDIKNVDYAKLPRGEYLCTGGFPCQPHSELGDKKGSKDKRDLWGECSRMLRDLRPRIALFENVTGLFTTNGGGYFNRVMSEIYESGYDAEWQTISARHVEAPHLRKRVFIIAYPNGDRSNKDKNVEKSLNKSLQEKRIFFKRFFSGIFSSELGRISEDFLIRSDNGVSDRLHAVKGLGNSVVPQCAELIFNLPAFDYWREPC